MNLYANAKPFIFSLLPPFLEQRTPLPRMGKSAYRRLYRKVQEKGYAYAGPSSFFHFYGLGGLNPEGNEGLSGSDTLKLSGTTSGIKSPFDGNEIEAKPSNRDFI